MISAGMPPPAARPDPKALRQQYDALSDQRDRLESAVQRARDVHGDAAEAYVEGRERTAETKSDEILWKQKIDAAQGLREASRSAGETRDSVKQNIKEEWAKLEPERKDVAGAYDLARFQRWMFEREFTNAWKKGILELTLENQNFGGVALLAFYRASLKMSAAVQGLNTGISTALELPSYFKVPDVPRDAAIEQFARSDAQAGSLKGKEDALREREGDDFYDNKARDKEAELADAEAQRKQAEAAREGAAKAEEGKKKERDDARADFNKASDATRDKSAEVRKKGAALEEAAKAKTPPPTAGRRRPARAGRGPAQAAAGGPAGGATGTPSAASIAAERRLREIDITELSAGQIPDALAVRINSAPNTVALRALLQEIAQGRPPAAAGGGG